ncbi:hypothetical protein [Peribacillus huizhouensis]|uniref:Uncharacterized protein n=1 Tax=Peribacillus huizhouensis TaxID=1501239 RepID=A0ABR6CW94_9BACI|nr:hypothetical protein [Peribacillus huizhouensis]MBA9029275.1 hypothetical protein [Peribacillus huizhouensis]
MVRILSLVAGVICIVISLLIYIPGIKKANSIKDKWMEFLDFVLDPFTGLTTLFYLGLLLMLYGLLGD